MNTNLSPSQIHDAKRFRTFFAAIPDEKWCTQVFADPVLGLHCARGHAILADNPDLEGRPTRAYYFRVMQSPSDVLLRGILPEVAEINNGWVSRYSQVTPRLRVLAALDDLINGAAPDGS